MGSPYSIVGFSSNNRVPGFYGETVYGAGSISAASLPITLLLIGQMLSTGSATTNQSILSVVSATQADNYFGPGSELARMCQAALRVPGVNILAAPVADPGSSPAQATLTITIAGTWTASGTLNYRVGGLPIQVTVGATDNITTVASNLSKQLNADPRYPWTASPSSGVVTLTVRQVGARGNQYLVFQDLSQAPAGLTSTLAGGTALTGGITPFSGGTGTDSNTTLLAILANQAFDRIVTAEIDATNLGAIATQLNTQSGPTINFLQHAIYCTSGTLSAANTIATGLNAYRMQGLWYLNSETYPAEIAAYFGALRCATEQNDPDAAYDDAVLPYVQPQSQPGDRPQNATLQSAINNGVTPIYTPNGTQALVCRSVTTHTLNGSTPDYRTLDTSQAYVPDFVRKDASLQWATSFRPNNPRVFDNPPANLPAPPSGVAYPDSWNSFYTKRLRDFEKGILSSGGSAAAAPTVAPIIVDVDHNQMSTVYSQSQKCLISVIPVLPAPTQHQIGVSVQNVTSA